jgi:hypothetical protein
VTDTTDETAEPFVCELCGEQFDSEAALVDHVRDAGLAR